MALVVAIALGASACSKDDAEPKSSDRKTISFSDAPEGSEALGLCRTYDLDKIKAIIGGDEHFRRLAPAAIGQEGDAVTGEVCAWERNDLNGDSLSLHIEVRNYGEDQAGLLAAYEERLDQATDPETVPGLGDAAFRSGDDASTVMQIRSGQYLMSLSSAATGTLEPVSADTMTLLAGAGLDNLP